MDRCIKIYKDNNSIQKLRIIDLELAQFYVPGTATVALAGSTDGSRFIGQVGGTAKRRPALRDHYSLEVESEASDEFVNVGAVGFSQTSVVQNARTYASSMEGIMGNFHLQIAMTVGSAKTAAKKLPQLLIQVRPTDYVTDPDSFVVTDGELMLLDSLHPVIHVPVPHGDRRDTLILSAFGYNMFSETGDVTTFGANHFAWTQSYNEIPHPFNISEIVSLLQYDLTVPEQKWLDTLKGKYTANQHAYMKCLMVVLQNNPAPTGVSNINTLHGPSLKAVGYTTIREQVVIIVDRLFRQMNDQANRGIKGGSTSGTKDVYARLNRSDVELNLSIFLTSVYLGVLDFISKIVFKVPFANGVQCLAPHPLPNLLKKYHKSISTLATNIGQSDEAQREVTKVNKSAFIHGERWVPPIL